ncbi:MAG TPA: hypothetical protein VNP92_22235 [Actinophytocola sp.]|nr:hypothetical protein [Actinophytocola sp.]
MAQLSFYSAEANPPARADLVGLLCGPSQLVSFGGVTARLSVPMAESWRGRAVRQALAERGVDATLYAVEDGLLVRTAFRRDLVGLAAVWTPDTAKAVPAGLTLAGASLRLWVLAAGGWTDGGYLLRLDDEAPQTHEPLGDAVTACGLPSIHYRDHDGVAGLRISGRRRLARLLELVGRPPCVAAESHWPAVSPVRQPV